MWREALRFIHQRERFVSALVRPLVWLFIFAAGFRQVLGVSIIPPYETYVLYEVYIAPGLIAMIQLFNGMQSSLTMVYDRETGGMRTLLVSPFPRWWLLTSKLLAGTLVSVLQVYAFLLIAWFWEIEPPPLGYLALLPALLLSGFMLGALGMLISSLIKQLENFAGVMNFVIFPMFFASSALYPLWRVKESSPLLYYVCELNPFTHATELIRFALYEQVAWVSLSVVVGCTVVFLFGAILAYDPARGFLARRRTAAARRTSATSERDPQAGVEGARPRRAERARVGEWRAAIGEIGNIAGIEECPVGRIAIVEDVVGTRVDLEGLVDLIRRMQVEDGVSRQLHELVGFVADEILAGDEKRIASDLEGVGDGIVDVGLDPVTRDRRDLVARHDLDVVVRRRQTDCCEPTCKRVQEARVDKSVAGVQLHLVRLETDFGLDALAAGRADVLEIAKPLQIRDWDCENVVRIVARNAPSFQLSVPMLRSPVPRRPASTVRDTTCFSGGSETRNDAMMQGCAGSAHPSSSGVGARLASE